MRSPRPTSTTAPGSFFSAIASRTSGSMASRRFGSTVVCVDEPDGAGPGVRTLRPDCPADPPPVRRRSTRTAVRCARMDVLRIAHGIVSRSPDVSSGSTRHYTGAIMRVLSRALRAAALLSIVCAASVEAQVIRVAGTIKDDDGHPVRGAIVTAENPDQTPPRLTTTSNDKGQFGFIGIRRGLWTFSVDAPGFEPVRFRKQVATGRQEPVQVTLGKAASAVAQPLDGTNAAEILQRIDRAESLASSGDVDGAIAAWREVIAKVPGLTSAHLQIGALYERKPDPEQALAAYRRLLEIEPANQKALAAIERLGKRL